MKILKNLLVGVFAVTIGLSISHFSEVFAAPPSVGIASTYSVLSSTYTNTAVGTTLNGDMGYTTGPAFIPTINGATHIGDGVYNQAGTDQGSSLSALSLQGCTFSFAAGAIDLSSDTTHGPIGVYTPGVYCSVGAMNIGGPITFNGSGAYLFRSLGALTSTVGSSISILGGASECDIFWTPTQAATLAANTVFKGSIIAPAGITIGANTTWIGRALAFGGTVTTDANTITVPTCTLAAPTLRVIKIVINNNGGTKTVNDFPLFVNGVAVISGAITSFPASVTPYAVTEPTNAQYTQTFSGDCNVSGNVTLSSGNIKTCTITNDDIPVSSPGGGGGGVMGGGNGVSFPTITPTATPTPSATPIATPIPIVSSPTPITSPSPTATPFSSPSPTPLVPSVVTPDPTPTPSPTPVPQFPNAGIPPQEDNTFWNSTLFASLLFLFFTFGMVTFMKRTPLVL
ncbi:MAG: ice-binding family protein [Candidatus Peregrinibacteria bacterium]